VTAKGNLRVEVLEHKRTLHYPLSQVDEDRREEFASYCGKGPCECVEVVQYLDFKGPVPGFRQVNAVEHAAAQRVRCSVDNSDVHRQALQFAVSARFISTAFFELEYCHGCGGSCHGNTKLATYDAQTGRALAIGDWLKPGAVEALRQHMIQYVLKTYATEEDATYVRTQLAQELAARKIVDEGFYVENGTLYVDIDSFVLGCAGGSFYPVAVPRELIAPAFAALL
jgi:hypothetical protein